MENKNRPTPVIPALDEIVERTKTQFYSRESYMYGKPRRIYAYSEWEASGDVVKQLVRVGKIDPFVLGPTLARQAKVTPHNFEFIEDNTWREVFINISESIIHDALLDKYPEIEEESDKRSEKYPLKLGN